MNITLENDTTFPKQIRLYRDGVYIAGIWHGGDDNDCKTEAEAREAAELLKAFFEAKQAGKVARLVVEGKKDFTKDLRPKNNPFAMSDTGRQFVGGPLSSDVKICNCVRNGLNPKDCKFDGCPTKEKLKPLKWVKHFVETYTCTTPWNHYIISRGGNYFTAEVFYLPEMQRQIFHFDTIEECMLLCQSDYASNVDNLFEQ